MSYDVTKSFFHWMEANNMSRQTAAELLGIDERSLSNYRSRGLPRRKHARATQIMLEHFAANKAAAVEDNRISVTFSDSDFKLVEEAAGIVGNGTKEFIHKAAISRAEEEIAKEEARFSSKVAEEHHSTPNRFFNEDAQRKAKS